MTHPDYWDYDTDEIAEEVGELADRLAETEAITTAQAEAYALRELYGVTRQDAADTLDKSPSTVDTLLARARDKVTASEEVIGVLEGWDAGEEARMRRMDEEMGGVPEHLGNPREAPDRRRHETYVESDHWTVVDIGGVDKVFATRSTDSDGGEAIRVDLDGVVAPSVASSDVVDDGENINVSAWLPEEQARELRDRLDDALDGE